MHDPKLRSHGEPLSRPCNLVWMGKLARETGLEPATSGVTGRRSNQLSYSRFGGGEALGREPDAVKRETRCFFRWGERCFW